MGACCDKSVQKGQNEIDDDVKEKINENKGMLIVWRNGCPFCDRAFDLLKKKGIPYEDWKTSSGSSTHNSLKYLVNQRTFPYVFFDNRLLGGFDDLKSKSSNG